MARRRQVSSAPLFNKWQQKNEKRQIAFRDCRFFIY